MVDTPLKVGFIGCGGISRELYVQMYAGLADIAQVVAVADPVGELAEERRRMLTNAYLEEASRQRVLADKGWSPQERKANRETHLRKAEAAGTASGVSIRKYRTHEELLNDDEVQVAVVQTPPPVRAEPVVAAAESGRHVFSEGPMAPSVEEADAIVAAVSKAGVKYVSQCFPRYTRAMALARSAVESGRLGEMGSARVEMNNYRPQSYFDPDSPSGHWQGSWEGEGGGAVFHQGRYVIDPFLWVVGSRVVEVFAYSGPVLRRVEHDSLSQAVVRFANGATGSIHASLITHRQPRGHRSRIEISGRDASLLVLPEENAPPDLTQASTSFASADNPAALEALEALRADVAHIPEQITQEYQTRLFLESIIDNTEPRVPIEVPRHHVELVRAIYKSAEERRPVTLPLDRDDPFYSRKGRLTHGVQRGG